MQSRDFNDDDGSLSSSSMGMDVGQYHGGGGGGGGGAAAKVKAATISPNWLL